jgi:hypothetical protein
MLKAFSLLVDTAFRDNVSYLAFKANELVVMMSWPILSYLGIG